jgi:iron complex outermembrane receptor protein
MVAFGFVSSARGLRAVRVVLFVLGVASLFPGDVLAQAADSEPPPNAEEAAPAGDDTAQRPPDETPPAPDVVRDEDLEPSGPIAPPPEGVEEITVVGEVLETSTQAEAQAITTFDQAQLDTLGIADVDSLALNTPSLHVGQSGQQAVITLRGVGLENLTSVGETGVGFQVDGVHLARPAAANTGFYDLERVDVLRGPQGTRGGRNLTGGKIALWSAKPTDELDAKGDVTYGNYDAIENRAVLNVPIWSDKLMSRVSTLFSRRRGYQDNDFFDVHNKDAGDAKDFSGRAQLRSMLFDDRIELRAIGTHGFQKGIGPDFKLINRPPSTLANTIPILRANFNLPGPGPPPGPFDDSKFVPDDCPPQTDPLVLPEVCTLSDVRDVYNDVQGDRDNENSNLTGMATWDLPIFQDTPVSDLRLGIVGGWNQTIEDFIYDLDGTNIPEQFLDQHRNAKQNSVEAYIERPDIGRWDFRAGFYFLDEEIDSDVCFDNGGVQVAFDFDYDGFITTKSLAGYGEGGVRLLDNFRAYGGVRWSKDEKTVEEEFFRVTRLPSQENPLHNPAGCGRYTLDLINRGQKKDPFIAGANVSKKTEEYQGVTPTVGFDWDVTESSTIGASVTKGFKAGGFPTVVQPGLVGLDQPYDSEETWEYEITSKNEFFDGRLRLNTTLFWVEYDPFQVCQFNGPAFFCNSNGSATIRGVEVEYIVSPIEGLQLNGFFNWLDARINNFELIDPTERVCLQPFPLCGTAESPPTVAFPLPTDLSGNSLTKSPAWAGAFGIQYEFDFGSWGYFTPRFQTQFQGKTYYRVFNTEFDSQDPFAKYDAKLMWRSEDERFSAEVFGVNLSDEDVLNSVLTGSQLTGGQALGQFTPPRTYGVKLGINYTSDWFADLL